jgi:predicted ArsR family transcriptional regulator
MSLEFGATHRRRVLDDPVSIRALAHPLRLKLVYLVGREGPITAAEAARQLDISQALASHHLRQLAKYGFVEPAAAGDHRERPWQATATSTMLREVENDPEVAAAGDVLEQMLADRAVAQLVDWQQRRDEWSEQWRRHTGIHQSLIYLTAEELGELRQALDAVIAPLVKRRPLGDVEARSDGAMPVDLTFTLVPLQPTPSGG